MTLSSSSAGTLPTQLEIWQKTLSWQPTEDQLAQFQRLYEHILEANQQLNLTRITEPLEFWEKHLWDSLAGIASMLRLEALAEETALQPMQGIDIGTGAGFPGVPVAIARPHWTVTLTDSTRKKITYLEKLTADLGLTNTRTVVGRAETLGQEKQHRDRYDLAMIRAVGPASVCAEYTLPLLRVGGLAVLYRGQWSEEDTKALEPAVETLGGEVASVESWATPLTGGVRNCLYLRKVGPTPREFPRLPGVPTQRPL